MTPTDGGFHHPSGATDGIDRTTGHLCRELLDFYGDVEGCNASGYTLEQVPDWPDVDWELQHDFVQWLFATDEPSLPLVARASARRRWRFTGITATTRPSWKRRS